MSTAQNITVLKLSQVSTTNAGMSLSGKTALEYTVKINSLDEQNLFYKVLQHMAKKGP